MIGLPSLFLMVAPGESIFKRTLTLGGSMLLSVAPMGRLKTGTMIPSGTRSVRRVPSVFKDPSYTN